MHLGVN